MAIAPPILTCTPEKYFVFHKILLWDMRRSNASPFLVLGVHGAVSGGNAGAEAESGVGCKTGAVHSGAILDVKMRGNRVLTASVDKTVKLWDVRRADEPIVTLFGHSGAGHCL